MARGEQWAETGVGAVVLVAAGVFLTYALGHAGGVKTKGGYELVAKFGDAGGLTPGADVRVAGVKVGAVSKIVLDPKTFQAETHMLMNNGVKLPDDSTIKVTTASLLGGQILSIQPGGSPDDMKPGGQFQNTQGAVDLFGLIGQVIRPQSPASGTPAAADQGAAPHNTPAPSTSSER